METFLLLFGLGFFLFVVWFITHREEVDYNRRLNERREFGSYFDKKTFIERFKDK